MSYDEKDAMPGSEAKILNNVDADQFEWREGAERAILSYRVRGDVIEYQHMVVPPALKNRGIAAELASHAVAYADANGLMIFPLCPYVLAYLAKHPEYGDLVIPRSRWTEILGGS